jgi:hypothetical protein
MAPNDCEVTRSKVIVTGASNVSMHSVITLKANYHKVFKIHIVISHN